MGAAAVVCDSQDGLSASLAAGEALIETRRLDENRDLRKRFLLSALLYDSIDAAAAAAAVVVVADISQTGVSLFVRLLIGQVTLKRLR